MAAILRDSTVVVVVVAVVRTRPRAIPLSMINHEKIHTWVSFSYMVMGLRLAALRAAGAPLQVSLAAVHSLRCSSTYQPFAPASAPVSSWGNHQSCVCTVQPTSAANLSGMFIAFLAYSTAGIFVVLGVLFG